MARVRGEGALRATRSASRWLLGATVVVAALALGAVHTWTLSIVAVALATAFGLAWWASRPIRARTEARIVLGVGAGLLGWTVAQAIPVPLGWLELVAAPNADVWRRALIALGEPGPAWAPLSLDPVATRVEVLRGIAYLASFGCALKIASSRDGVRFLEVTLLVSATLVAVSAMAHHAVGAERVFGIYRPQTADFSRVGPLLNTNHLSAYLNVGTCVALGLALAPPSSLPRVVPGAVAVLLAGAQLWTGSRAGVAAAALGMVLVVWLDRRRGGARWGLPAALGASALLAAFVLTTRPRLIEELTDTDTFKLRLLRQAIPAVRTYSPLGMGRGAFEPVFPAFRADGEGHVAFAYPENIVVQWSAEWGVLAAAVALVALAIALRPAASLARSAPPIGCAAAVIAVACHNLLDFSLEVPGVAIAVSLSAAAVVGGAPRGTSARARAALGRPRVAVVALGVGTAIAVAVALSGASGELHRDREALRDLALATTVDEARFVDAAREAMLRHPADPYLPFMGAVRAARTGDRSPIPFLSRTLERASVYGRAHLLLARHLRRRSPAQARFEYRLAMEQDFNLVGVAVAEGASLVRAPDDALQLVPEGRLAEGVIIALEGRLRREQPEAARRLVDELAVRVPSSSFLARRRADDAIAALRASTPPCDVDRARCVAAARTQVGALLALEPRACHSHQLSAELLALEGDEAGAVAVVERALDVVEDPAACHRYLADQAEVTGDATRLERALERMVGACEGDDACAAAAIHAADAEARRGRSQLGLRHLKRAHTRMPDRVDVLAAIARLAEASGAHAQALDAYKKLVEREPGRPAWREGLARVEAARRDSRGRTLGLPSPSPP